MINPQIVERFLKNEFGENVKENRHDDWRWAIPSPFKTNDKEKRLHFNTKRGFAHDFTTGENYDFWTVVKLVKGFDTNDQAVRYILEISRDIRNIVQFDKHEKRKVNIEPLCSIALPKEYEPIPIKQWDWAILKDAMRWRRIVEYVNDRRITNHDIKKYSLGVCRSGEYVGRIIIPFFENGETVFFQGRSIDKNAALRYKNPNAEIREKSSVVFNIDAITDDAIVCEGVFDAMVVNGQCCLGKDPSDVQIEKIVNKTGNLTLALDNDIAGIASTLKLASKLADKKIKVKIVTEIGDKDFSEIGKEKSLLAISLAKPWCFKTMIELRQKLKNAEKIKITGPIGA